VHTGPLLRFRIILPVVALVLLAIGIVMALLLLSARNSISSGIDEMRQAQALLHIKNVEASPESALAGTQQHVAQAHLDFDSASTKLSPLSFVLQRLFWLPRLGQDVAAAPMAARTAEQLTAGMLPLLQGLQPILTGFHHGTKSHTSISVLVGRLAASHASFARSCQLLNDAKQTRQELRAYHSPRLSSALHTIDHQLPNLLRVCDGLSLAPALLGYPHRRTYFLAYQDPAELRATGGFIGSVGLVSVHNGITRQQFGTTGFDQENETVPTPQPMLIYNNEPAWYLRDANWSPNFPTTAGVERYLLQIDRHVSPQGVINITPAATADVLAATGPIYSPEYQRWITSANIAQLADYYTHWSPVPGPYRYQNAGNEAKQFIQIMAHHMIQRLNTLTPSQWVQLFQSLSSAVATRDVQLSLTSPKEQQLIHQIGADGMVRPTTSDYLYMVDSNMSYNKINPYVRIKQSYQVRVRPDRWLQAKVTITYTDGPVPQSLRTHGVGPGAGAFGSPLDYAEFLRVYVPAGAQLISQSGWTQPWTGGPAYGKTMFCGYLVVPNGQTRVITLEYVVPANVFSWSNGARYRLVVQHQAGSQPEQLDIAVQTGVRGTTWSIPHPSRDWERTISIPLAPFHPIPLPAEPPTVAAPGHLLEPHAFFYPAKHL